MSGTKPGEAPYSIQRVPESGVSPGTVRSLLHKNGDGPPRGLYEIWLAVIVEVADADAHALKVGMKAAVFIEYERAALTISNMLADLAEVVDGEQLGKLVSVDVHQGLKLVSVLHRLGQTVRDIAEDAIPEVLEELGQVGGRHARVVVAGSSP